MSKSEHDPDDRFRDQFSDYYDDELDAEARSEFEAWLEADRANAAEYEVFRESLDGLRLFGEFEAQAPKSFVRDVTQDIRKQSRGAFFNDTYLFGYRVPYEVFAAVALVVFAAIYLFGGALKPSYSVRDAETAAPELDDEPTDPLGSRAAGVEREMVSIPLAPGASLDAVAAELRRADFAARPALVEGKPALVVSVPDRRRDAFLERIFVATGTEVRDLLTASSTSPVTTVRLTVKGASAVPAP